MARFQARRAPADIAFVQRDHAERGRNVGGLRRFVRQGREELFGAIELARRPEEAARAARARPAGKRRKPAPARAPRDRFGS